MASDRIITAVMVMYMAVFMATGYVTMTDLILVLITFKITVLHISTSSRCILAMKLAFFAQFQRLKGLLSDIIVPCMHHFEL